MRYFILFLTLNMLLLTACSPKLNGKMVEDLHADGISAEGKKYKVDRLGDTNATVCYLVRHAEKASGKDPELTEAGTARAEKLGKMLESVPLNAVYSTNYKRTINTAAPTAEFQKIELEKYDGKKQEILVEQLKGKTGGKFLIVGHSNSIPNMLNLFQSKTVYEHIPEKEYDNLYIVTINKSGKVNVLTLKY